MSTLNLTTPVGLTSPPHVLNHSNTVMRAVNETFNVTIRVAPTFGDDVDPDFELSIFAYIVGKTVRSYSCVCVNNCMLTVDCVRTSRISFATWMEGVYCDFELSVFGYVVGLDGT